MAALAWAWQGGTAGVDQFLAAMMGSDGSSVLAGLADKTTTAVDLTTYWTAVKFDADGDVLWTWQDDITGDEDDIVRAADMDEDGFVVLAGSGDNNFQVIKLDPDGSVVWRFQEGSESIDYADGIALGDDGSMVVGGATSGEWDITNLGIYDMAAFKLDTNGTLLWKWQGGTTSYETASDVAMADDGSVVLSGISRGDFTGDNASFSSSSSVDFEYTFAAIKLDSDGTEVWRWQDGPKTEDTSLRASTITQDGSFLLVGYSDGVWSGSASAGGIDFAAVKLDADGNEVCRWQNGTSADDLMTAATIQADGTIVLGGYTAGDWIGSNEGGYDFAVVALDANLEEIWRWQHGAKAFGVYDGSDYMGGISAGSDGRIVLGGGSYGSFAETNVGMGDLVAVMLDTNALATPSPTTTLPPAAAPTSPAAPTPSPSPPATPAAGPVPTPTSNTSPTTPPAPPAPTSAPSPATMPATSLSGTTQGASNVAPIAAGVASAVVGAALIALGLCLLKRKHDKKRGTAQQVHPPVAAVDGVNGPPTSQSNRVPLPPPYLHPAAGVQTPSAPPPPPYMPAIAARQQTGALPPPPYQHAVAAAMAAAVAPAAPAVADVGGGGKDRVSPFPAAIAAVVRHGAERTKQAGVDDGDRHSFAKGDTEPATHAGRYSGGSVASERGQHKPITHVNYGGGGSDGDGRFGLREGDFKGGSAEPGLIVTTSTDNISTGERNVFAPAYGGDAAVGAAFIADEPKPTFDELGAFSSTDGRASAGPPGLGRAVGEAALELARNCLIPGVSEAAAAVSILVELLAGNNDTKNNTEPSLRRCRSIVMMLQRAAKVLGKGGDTTGTAERAMMEDVHDAISDLVELIKTYQSKNRLSQLLMSTLFRRRQDEMGAVVDRAILSLQLGLQVQVGNDVSAFKDDMHLYKGSMEEAQSKSLAEARRSRRQRKLDKIEIPEDHVAITDELLGKGGFGEVYLADYNGRNAAAKVLQINNDLGKRGEIDILDGSTGERVERQREKSQRKSFLLELDAMIRLRSPYTVNVYGAVTARPDRLVLVMELLSGGDLRSLLGSCENPLPEQQSRQIIGDICAGMAFLHSKDAVHGDLKSANVLLDGAGRAKIGDFGTSRWTQNTMSTGLATFTANSSKSTHMSLAWSAPEVLHAAGSTYASDVYSFGIVVWEVLSRELPWATVTNPKEIFIRVVLNDMRPAMPDGTPTEIADMARACWVDKPKDRPTFSAIMESMKTNGWNQ